jgi:hypothetical protein
MKRTFVARLLPKVEAHGKSDLRMPQLYQMLDVSSDNTDKMKVMRTVLEGVRNLGFEKGRIHRYNRPVKRLYLGWHR